MSTLILFLLLVCGCALLTNAVPLKVCESDVLSLDILAPSCSSNNEQQESSHKLGLNQSGKKHGKTCSTTAKQYKLGHLELKFNSFDVYHNSFENSLTQLHKLTSTKEIGDALQVECKSETQIRPIVFTPFLGTSDDDDLMCKIDTQNGEHENLFILPQLKPHSETKIGQYMKTQLKSILSSSSLNVLLILSVSSAHGKREYLSESSLSSCKVMFKPISLQKVFPPSKLLLKNTKSSKFKTVTSGFMCTPKSHPRRLPRSSLLLVPSAAQQDNTHTRDTDLINTRFNDVNTNDETEFIETQATVFTQWVGSSIKAVIKPVIRIIEDQTAINSASSIQSQLKQTLLQRVPTQVSYLIKEPLRRNITNMAVDGISGFAVPVLEKSLTLSLSTYVSDHVYEWISEGLNVKLTEILHGSLGDELINNIPAILRRSLPLTLTQTLNRALTHAITPTVAISLSRSSNTNHYCHLCYYQKKACWLCSTSPDSVYYNNYHSTYYADYFSDYYTPYYFNAMNKVVNRDLPTSIAETAGYADQTGKDQGPGPKA